MSSGFSVLEVLISLMLISLFLLGIEGSQLYALRSNQQAYFLSLAMNQLQSLAERLQVHSSVDDLEFYLQQWNEQNKKLLPQGVGRLNGNYPNYKITLFWKGERQCLSQDLQL